MPVSAPQRPDPPDDDSGVLLDPRQPGRFRRIYIAVAVLVMLALIIGLLGPLVWRLV